MRHSCGSLLAVCARFCHPCPQVFGSRRRDRRASRGPSVEHLASTSSEDELGQAFPVAGSRTGHGQTRPTGGPFPDLRR